MIGLVPNPPQRRHWEMLRKYRANKPKRLAVELEEFLSFWEVSNAELAEICECSISTVEKWFLSPDNPNRRSLSEEYKHRLAEVHFLWWEMNPANQQRINRIREMYREKPRPKT